MKKLIILYTFLAIGFFTKAQQDPLYSHYAIQPYLINPAYIGDDSLISVFTLYRNQWSGIPGTPNSQVLTIDGKLNNKRGYLGGYAWNDQSNIIKKTGGMITYAYQVELGSNQFIKAGISVGAMQVGINFDKVIAEDKTEATLLQNGASKTSPDAAFGLRYTNKAFEFGLSSNHLLNSRVTLTEETNFKAASYQSIKNFFIHASYKWEANQDFDVKPTILMRSNQGLPSQFDLQVNTTWKNLVWLGVGYRQNYGVTTNVGGNLTENIALGYGYDIATTGIGKQAGGTHEFFLRFRLGGKRDKSAQVLADSALHEVEVDHERITTIEDRINGMDGAVNQLERRLDSLKKEVAIHEVEIDSLKLKKDDLQSQITDNKDLMNEKLIELRKIKDQLNKDRSKIHDFVDLEHVELAEVDTFDTKRWHYYVVLGTYTDINYAKFLQRVLVRDYGIQTTLESSNDYMIVYSKEVFKKEEAIEEIKRLNTTVNKEYLADGAWVYHKRKSQ